METLTAMLDSLRPADSARSAETTQHRRPTSKDILAGGYNCQREIPEPVECEFCGRKLYHEALVMGRTVLMFAPFPQDKRPFHLLFLKTRSSLSFSHLLSRFAVVKS